MFSLLTTCLFSFALNNAAHVAAIAQQRCIVNGSGLAVIKLFQCSTQLSMKFLMLKSKTISRNAAFFRLR